MRAGTEIVNPCIKRNSQMSSGKVSKYKTDYY